MLAGAAQHGLTRTGSQVNHHLAVTVDLVS